MRLIRVSLAAALAVTGTSFTLPTQGWSAITELVVTTRKRSESLQDVPLSISAFNAQDIQRQGILGVADLALSTPGLSIESQGGGAFVTPVIRGMAQNVLGSDLGYDNNVGIFVNGVYQSNRNSLDLDLIGVERIEVAKGPQSALYGRSTFAGAINYIYAEPTDEFSGSVTGTVGSDEDYGATIDLGGPIVEDRLKGRISIGYREFDGTFENLAGGENVQGYESFAAAGALVFTPTDELSVTFNGLYSDRENEQPAQFLNGLNCGSDIDGDPTYFCGNIDAVGDVSISPGGFNKTETQQYSMKAEYGTDSVIFTSLTSYTETTADSILDRDYGALADGTGLTLDVCSGPFCFFAPAEFVVTRTETGVQSNAFQDTGTEDISQEFRLQSNDADGYSWMVGASYYESETFTDTRASLDGGPLAPGENYYTFIGSLFVVDDPITESLPFSDFESDTEAWAVFGQVSWDITDSFSVTGEARYTHEEKDLHVLNNFGTATDDRFNQSFNFISPRVTLEYKPQDNMLFYGSAAKGVRTGGINGSVSADPVEAARERFFDPETNWTYELGAKTTVLDDRLQLNGSVYYTDWTDTQLPALNSDLFGTHVTNVDGGVEVWGLELSGIAVLSDMITVNGGYAYADPEFTGGTFDGSVVASCGIAEDLCTIGMDSSGNTAADVSGQKLGRVASHQASAGIVFAGEMSNMDWDWYAQANVNYQSENNARSINGLTYGERTVVNTRAGIGNESYEIALWAKNLFDEEYVSSQSLQPGFDGVRRIDVYQGDGRRFGVTGTLRF